MRRRNPTAEQYEALADEQRGEPEAAMLRLQRVTGGGLLSYVAEHLGDLTHRMNEFARGGRAGGREKVTSVLNSLRHRYGFQREVREQLQRNEADLDKVGKAMQEYADAHAALPAYNAAQKHARDAAVAYGRWNFTTAVRHLAVLEKHVGSYEEWDRFCLAGLPKRRRLPS